MMGRTVRSHFLTHTWSLEEQDQATIDLITAKRAACFNRAEREGWGRHLGDTVLGET